MNSYINYTRSYSYAAVKCLTDPLGPMNEGALRPVTVTAPEGSFLNPRPPAGGGPRAIICYRTFEAVLGALAPALPDRVAAAASHFANPTFGGWDRARQPPLRGLRAGAVGYRRPRAAATAARGCRGRSTPRTSRSRRRRRRSRSSSSASASLPTRRAPAVPRRLRRPPRHAIPGRRGQAHQPLGAPALRAVRRVRRQARPAGAHRDQPRARRGGGARQAVARVRVRRRHLLPAVGGRRLR